MNPQDLVPHKKMPELFPELFPTLGSWEWAYRNRYTNGLAECIIDVNNKGHVDIPRFKQNWLESRRESPLKSA